MKNKKIFGFTLFVFIIIGFWGILIYNDIVKAENETNEWKANVETVLQRRFDLIPNIVNVVKGYAHHEKATFSAVVQARSNVENILKEIKAKKYLQKNDMEILSTNQNQLKGMLNKMFALVENYPKLKVNSNFLALQSQLEGTENRINVARQRYNNSIKHYNTKIAVIPGLIIAKLFGFKKRILFKRSAI